MTKEALSDYVFTAKYARYDPVKGRRETYDEAVERMFAMHRRKFPDRLSDLSELEQLVKDRVILGSQRALQFGGPPVEKCHARGYNCSFSYADRPRFFQEALWLLLCGCGVGFSVQYHHVAKLPPVSRPTGSPWTFVVPDTIEGWADALGCLLSSYFSGAGPVSFDYSQVRPEGSPLSSGTGRAPGPQPLADALEEVRRLLDRCSPGRLRPIDAYDVVMHAAGAVLSGGIRRSATIALFSPSDHAMATAKTGDWMRTNPQRKNANNSALLVRGATDFEVYADLIASAREFGEPGVVWADSSEHGTNPCQPGFATVLTEHGIRTFDDLVPGCRIWSKDGWTEVVDKWSTGIKPVFRYRTTSGEFVGTENHRVVQAGRKVEVGEAEAIDSLRGPARQHHEIIPEAVMDGLLIGDGTVHKAGGGVFLIVGDHDQDYFMSEIAPLIDSVGYGGNHKMVRVKHGLEEADLCRVWDRRIPEQYMRAPRALASFLRGLYTANGSVVRNRVVLKTTSPGLRDDVQIALSSLGIKSYYTTNAPQEIEHANGLYTSRESYDVNISVDLPAFRAIGFLQQYKMQALEEAAKVQRTDGKRTFDIRSVEYLGDFPVWDITVDNASHTYWTGGVDVSNCGEVGFYPVDEQTGQTGWQFCNLSTVNVPACRNEQEFLAAAAAASRLGTYQAAYTTFRYLGEVSERITRREALLGVSLTGIQDNPDLGLDEDLLRLAAAEVVAANEEVAEAISINPAARTTCVKPEGTASCLLGTASGIHPQHAKRYLRRVQANRLEPPAQLFAEVNPLAVEASAWGARDNVLTFCCEAPEGASTAGDVSALELLRDVRLVKEAWVDAGKVPERCVDARVSHNVSNTIYVRPEQWGAVAAYIYEHRRAFAGVSLLAASGDLDYPQAPFVEVPDAGEIVAAYGPGALLASGLIVDGLRAFGELWLAVDAIEDGRLGLWAREPTPEQADVIRRGKQFAGRYFAGNVHEMGQCLKHVHNAKLWEDLTREFRRVDYASLAEDGSAVAPMALAACSGGACELK